MTINSLTLATRKITIEQFHTEIIAKYGDDRDKWAFKCPNCGQQQTVADFKAIGVDPNEAYFSCIGRYVEGRGCKWTLGGFLKIHTLEVIVNDKSNPCFEIA